MNRYDANTDVLVDLKEARDIDLAIVLFEDGAYIAAKDDDVPATEKEIDSAIIRLETLIEKKKRHFIRVDDVKAQLLLIEEQIANRVIGRVDHRDLDKQKGKLEQVYAQTKAGRIVSSEDNTLPNASHKLFYEILIGQEEKAFDSLLARKGKLDIVEKSMLIEILELKTQFSRLPSVSDLLSSTDNELVKKLAKEITITDIFYGGETLEGCSLRLDSEFRDELSTNVARRAITIAGDEDLSQAKRTEGIIMTHDKFRKDLEKAEVGTDEDTLYGGNMAVMGDDDEDGKPFALFPSPLMNYIVDPRVGHMYGFAAPSGGSKTMIQLAIGKYLMEKGETFILYTLEGNKKTLAARILSMLTAIPADIIRKESYFSDIERGGGLKSFLVVQRKTAEQLVGGIKLFDEIFSGIPNSSEDECLRMAKEFTLKAKHFAPKKGSFIIHREKRDHSLERFLAYTNTVLDKLGPDHTPVIFLDYITRLHLKDSGMADKSYGVFITITEELRRHAEQHNYISVNVFQGKEDREIKLSKDMKNVFDGVWTLEKDEESPESRMWAINLKAREYAEFDFCYEYDFTCGMTLHLDNLIIRTQNDKKYYTDEAMKSGECLYPIKSVIDTIESFPVPPEKKGTKPKSKTKIDEGVYDASCSDTNPGVG